MTLKYGCGKCNGLTAFQVLRISLKAGLVPVNKVIWKKTIVWSCDKGTTKFCIYLMQKVLWMIKLFKITWFWPNFCSCSQFNLSNSGPDFKAFCCLHFSSHALTSDLNLTDVAKAAEYFLSDGIIVTGSHTGNPVKTEDMNLIFKSNLQLPILIGSGVDTDNLQRFMNAHGLIIGSHFKECSDWRKAIDIKRLSVFMKRLHQLQI